MSKAWDRAMELEAKWEYTPAIREGIASLVEVLQKVEWEGGGFDDSPNLDYYDSGERSEGFCPKCHAHKDRGHKPGCQLAKLIGAKTVTSKQAERNKQKALEAQWAAERAAKAKAEAEYQAYLDTLAPEQRAEEERKRASQLELARDHQASMERAFLFGAEPSPLTKLLQYTKGIKTGVKFEHPEPAQ